jgi:hypothetical protein
MLVRNMTPLREAFRGAADYDAEEQRRSDLMTMHLRAVANLVARERRSPSS